MVAGFWGFLWRHFWKLTSFAVTTGFIMFVAMVQSPAQVEARIRNLEVGQDYLKSENLTLQIGLGVNNTLFQQIYSRQDETNKALMRLSEQVSRAYKP